MKKVININFQGRVIPIEEAAYETLKKYTESLSKFFANEEGKEEIINDIEGRIAELFAETLKKGSTCICDEDVNRIISSMGKPEDFEAEEINVKEQLGGNSNQYQQQNNYTYTDQPRGRLYRDDNDKILGGVCGGLANYLRVDVSVVRILFAILTFGAGTGFLIYLLLWIVLPSKNLQTNLTKRLYRNPDEKVIGGVSSGLAAYFNIAVWIPRLIFAFPLLLGVINSIFHNLFWNFDPFPSIFFGSFGGSLTLIYLVLWGVIPEANSASEKLEMRGDKVDLNSIKNTIQDDLEGFKGRAEKYGKEFGEKAKQWGDSFSAKANERGQQFTREVNTAARSNGKRIGHAIGIVFKAFFLFIAGMIAFALLMALLGVLMGGVSFFPIKNFFIEGFWQNALAWATVVGFLIVPIIAFLVWIIRRIMKVKSNRFLGATFGSLWALGLISLIILASLVGNGFKTKGVVESSVNFVQPSSNKLVINIEKDSANFYGGDWFGIEWDKEDAPFYGISEDSLLLKTVRIDVNKSKDSLYHIRMYKFSRARNPELARKYAQSIQFDFKQKDSVVTLPKGFIITKNDKFRNQQVLIVIEVPYGKKIKLDDAIGNYNWFELNYNRKNNWNISLDKSNQHSLHWDEDVEMIMGERDLINPNDKHHIDDDSKDELNDIERQQKELDKRKREILKDSIPAQKTPVKTATTLKSNVSKVETKQFYLASILTEKFSF